MAGAAERTRLDEIRQDVNTYQRINVPGTGLLGFYAHRIALRSPELLALAEACRAAQKVLLDYADYCGEKGYDEWLDIRGILESLQPLLQPASAPRSIDVKEQDNG